MKQVNINDRWYEITAKITTGGERPTCLIAQARRRHYSTFSLYEPEEFENALAEFRDRVSAAAIDINAIAWHDENVLIHARRDDN